MRMPWHMLRKRAGVSRGTMSSLTRTDDEDCGLLTLRPLPTPHPPAQCVVGHRNASGDKKSRIPACVVALPV
jgi:hypothetical protein